MNRSLKAVKKILLLCLHSVLGQRGGVGNVLFSMGNELYNLGYNMYVVICDSNTNDNIPYSINDNVNIINIADSNYKSDLTIWQKLRRNLSGNRDARHRYEENILDRYISKRLKPVISDIKPDLAIAFSTDATRILHRDVLN